MGEVSAFWRDVACTRHHSTVFFEGSAQGDAFDVQVHSAQLRAAGENTFSYDNCFIGLALTPSMMRGSYDRRAGLARYRPLDGVHFIPEGPLHCIWEKGLQRGVGCLVNVNRLYDRFGLEWRWPVFDPSDFLTLRNDAVATGLRQIVQDILSPGFGQVAQLEISLLFIFSQLVKAVNRPASTAERSALKLLPGQVERLREMLIDGVGEMPSVRELAEEIGLDGRRLSEALRRTVGLNLRNFIAQARLEKSRQLLLDRRLLIKQIAHMSGFKTAPAFSAAFFKATGQTPVDFRNRIFGLSN